MTEIDWKTPLVKLAKEFSGHPYAIDLIVGTVLEEINGPEIKLFVMMDKYDAHHVLERVDQGNKANEFVYPVRVIWPDPADRQIPIEMIQIAEFGEVILDRGYQWELYQEKIRMAFAKPSELDIEEVIKEFALESMDDPGGLKLEDEPFDSDAVFGVIELVEALRPVDATLAKQLEEELTAHLRNQLKKLPKDSGF